MWHASKISEFFSEDTKFAYLAFLENMRKVAALNIVVPIAEEMLCEITPQGDKFGLSDDFDESFTTMIDDHELVKSSKVNEYTKLCNELSLISMVSLFELYVKELVVIAGLNVKEAESYRGIENDFNITPISHVTTMKMLYFIIKKMGIKTICFENKETYRDLEQIIDMRNALAHHGGKVWKDNHMKSIKKCYRDEQDFLKFSKNSMDSLLHYIVIHARALTLRLDRSLRENIEHA